MESSYFSSDYLISSVNYICVSLYSQDHFIDYGWRRDERIYSIVSGDAVVAHCYCTCMEFGLERSCFMEGGAKEPARVVYRDAFTQYRRAS